ncbi:MAG TPA: hypothetical protein VLW55_08970 [Burkholderiaceae bacterium]|nr:hypothetical protein [Burkholderiaceae bacterium]
MVNGSRESVAPYQCRLHERDGNAQARVYPPAPRGTGSEVDEKDVDTPAAGDVCSFRLGLLRRCVRRHHHQLHAIATPNTQDTDHGHYWVGGESGNNGKWSIRAA